MSTTLLIVLCCAPLIGIFMFLGATQKRREAQAMRDFAALLENGSATPGQAGKGPRAMGRWKGREVTVRFFARLHPPVFLTAVAMSRRPSPLVALLVPRGDRPVAHREATADAPPWIVALDHAYDAGCAPTESFRVVMDESTATLLMKLESTEVEVLPTGVSVQRREVLYDATKLVPLLDAATELVDRLDALQAQLVGPTEEERLRRTAEVTNFLNGFQP